MNFSLKPHPLVAHWVPGLVALLIIILSAFDWDPTRAIKALTLKQDSFNLTIAILAVVAFPVGEILDAVRSGIIESFWDRVCNGRWEIKWEFFFRGGTRELKNLHEHYFTWYVLDLNLSLAIFLGYCYCFYFAPVRSFAYSHSLEILLWAGVILAALLIDAGILREEIRRNIKNWCDNNPSRGRNPYNK